MTDLTGRSKAPKVVYSLLAVVAVAWWSHSLWVGLRPSPPKDPAERAAAREAKRKAKAERAREAAQNFDDSASSAVAWCRAAVRERLKSPGSAEFKSIFDDTLGDATRVGYGRWSVRSWVDSQNDFGATVRAHFVCEVNLRDKTATVVFR